MKFFITTVILAAATAAIAHPSASKSPPPPLPTSTSEFPISSLSTTSLAHQPLGAAAPADLLDELMIHDAEFASGFNSIVGLRKRAVNCGLDPCCDHKTGCDTRSACYILCSSGVAGIGCAAGMLLCVEVSVFTNVKEQRLCYSLPC
jgi:hypothetical protein